MKFNHNKSTTFLFPFKHETQPWLHTYIEVTIFYRDGKITGQTPLYQIALATSAINMLPESHHPAKTSLSEH